MKEILELIENVDPDDTAKLDEIDARVAEYLGLYSYWESKHEHYNIDYKDGESSTAFPCHAAYDGYDPSTGKKKSFPKIFPYSYFFDWSGRFPQYTRNRSALKVIRPEGWLVGKIWEPMPGAFSCELYQKEYGFGAPDLIKSAWKLPTEELAELHAILQAIHHDRGEK